MDDYYFWRDLFDTLQSFPDWLKLIALLIPPTFLLTLILGLTLLISHHRLRAAAAARTATATTTTAVKVAARAKEQAQCGAGGCEIDLHAPVHPRCNVPGQRNSLPVSVIVRPFRLP